MGDDGQDTMTLTFRKARALWVSIAGVAASVVLIGGFIIGGVRWGVNELFEEKIKADMKDPKSELSIRLDDKTEEKVVEVIQAVVDDDMAYQNLRIERLEDDVKRLEGR